MGLNLSDVKFLNEIRDENLKIIKDAKGRTTHTGTSVLLTFAYDHLGRLYRYDSKSPNAVEVAFKIGGDMAVNGIDSIHFNNQVVIKTGDARSIELLGNEHTVANSLIEYAGVKPDGIKDIDIKVGEVGLSVDQKVRLMPKV